ncbi:ENTH domain-containing protein 1, partial [Eublepharis macularius]|uniref:ENTH domain-containing protein 1 n=1 Tax=Eublepharis macularius TaxID=481883 RepID=A0AA97JV60_EUBMA
PTSMALRRHMKNFVKNYSEAEIKVREATSNDPWGPSSSLMLEISDFTYNKVSFSEVMSMIWRRMNDHGKNWRHVYKSLTLLDYLLKNGSKKVIQHCQEGLYNIQMLKDFHHIDEAGKDQGFYVREKSKQVIALLTDGQQLHNEREIARRTRQRTSYSTLFPPKTSGKTCSSATPASDPISEIPPSENIPYFSLKASPAAEQRQSAQIPGKEERAYETAAPSIVTKKTSEDLIVFSEDEPSTFAEQSTFPTRVSREELATDKKAAASTRRKAKTTLNPSERLPEQKWASGREPESSVVSSVMLKAPPKKETGENKVTETFFDLWSIPPEEFIPIPPEDFIPTNKQVSKSDFVHCSSELSVETIYRSPTLQAFDPLGSNTVVNTTKSTPTSSMQFCGPYSSCLQDLDFPVKGTAQTANLSNHLSPRPDSNSSVGTTSSFSTFSTSSPESVAQNNKTQAHCISPHGPSYVFAPLRRPSLLFKDLKERITHSFSQVSDLDEIDNTSIVSLLPDNSKCSVKKVNSFRSRTCHALGGSTVKSLMHNLPPVPPGMPCAANLPRADCESSDQMAVLEEIKNAVCGLREDFCSAAQDLHTIRSEFTAMKISMQKMIAPQTAQGASGQK